MKTILFASALFISANAMADVYCGKYTISKITMPNGRSNIPSLEVEEYIDQAEGGSGHMTLSYELSLKSKTQSERLLRESLLSVMTAGKNYCVDGTLTKNMLRFDRIQPE